MKLLLLTLTIFALLTLGGCGYKEGVKTQESRSYLYFTGFSEDEKSVTVSIDGSERFSVLPGELNRYATKPGKHHVEVYKDGVKVVDRELYLGDGIAREIELR